jgi:hypothetical protein
MTLRVSLGELAGLVKPAKARETTPLHDPDIVCPLGKQAYTTRERANAAKRTFNREAALQVTTVFRCDYCDHYHLGHRR